MDDLDIRERLAGYAAEKVGVDAFEMWLTEASAEDDLSQDAERLVFDALRLVSELRNGDWDESDVRGKIGGLNRNYWLQQAVAGADSASVTLVKGSQLAVGVQTVRAAGSA
jgi:hypothetical protein